MIYYIFFLIIFGVLVTIWEKAWIVYLLVFPFFLYFLPANIAPDFAGYEGAFVTSYFVEEFPFFAHKISFDSEPLYLFYQGIFSVLLQKKFRLFLVFNFLICYFLLWVSVKKLQFTSNYNFNIAVFFLAPIVAPTLFFFLVRSSLSFFLVLLGFSCLANFQWKRSCLWLYLGFSFHSQYIISSLFMICIYLFVARNIRKGILFAVGRIFLVSLSGFLFLFLLENFFPFITRVASILPHEDFFLGKLHYLTDDYASRFRLTSVLSIVIYPLCAFFLLKRSVAQSQILSSYYKNKLFILLLFSLSLLGMGINVVFWGNTHVAGRLARFSDYIGIILIIPLAFSLLGYNGKIYTIIVGFIFIALGYLFYPSVY